MQLFGIGMILGFWAISLMILGILISSFSAYWQSRSHECLLNLGRDVRHYLLLVCGVAFAVLALGYGGGTTKWVFWQITMVVFCLLLSAFFLTTGLRPFQVREDGIWGLYPIRWHEIRSYHWRKNFLIISTNYDNRSLFLWLFRRDFVPKWLYVPLRYKETLDEMLQQKVQSLEQRPDEFREPMIG